MPTIKLLMKVLLEPKFDEQEFALEKKKQDDAITQSFTSASAIAENVFKKIIYGESHVMGNPVNGTSETLAKITLEDVKAYYMALNGSMMSVAVSGAVIQPEVIEQLAFLSYFKNGETLKADLSKIPSIDKTKIYFVDKKAAAQSEIRIGYMAIPYDVLGDFYKATIMNFSFAGAFNSRTNYLLREIKGWTYGTRGAFSGSEFEGPYTIRGGFKANATDSTITEIFRELKQYATDGITVEELEFTRKAMAQSDALKYESPLQKLGFIKRVLDYNLNKNYVAEQTQLLNSIKSEEINGLAKKYLPHSNMIIVVVGDKTAVFEKIKQLQFDMIELDNSGNAIQ